MDTAGRPVDIWSPLVLCSGYGVPEPWDVQPRVCSGKGLGRAATPGCHLEDLQCCLRGAAPSLSPPVTSKGRGPCVHHHTPPCWCDPASPGANCLPASKVAGQPSSPERPRLRPSSLNQPSLPPAWTWALASEWALRALDPKEPCCCLLGLATCSWRTRPSPGLTRSGFRALGLLGPSAEQCPGDPEQLLLGLQSLRKQAGPRGPSQADRGRQSPAPAAGRRGARGGERNL